jgi:2-dehydro-3-deoxyphosphogluconate aldolase/(4S)-4-hydroxy-2-oxoglutarate aldolase
MRFCPTGGLTVQSVPEYLALPNVVVCGGTWLTPADAVLAQDWERITRLAREAAALGPARQAS